MESASTQPLQLPFKPRDSIKNSTYGVESIESTISSLSEDSDFEDGEFDSTRERWKKNLAERLAQSSEEPRSRSPSLFSSYNVSEPASPPSVRRTSYTETSRPYTPISLYSATPNSVISSPGSRRGSRASDLDSMNDETSSQAIISSGEDEEDVSGMMDSGSAPQLVMPSIKMPSRRPFTERGRNMGRLKILIAGDSGMNILVIHATLLTHFRRGKDIADKGHCTNMRRYRSRRSTCYSASTSSRKTAKIKTQGFIRQ
jgi:hypothetical protein